MVKNWKRRFPQQEIIITELLFCFPNMPDFFPSIQLLENLVPELKQVNIPESNQNNPLSIEDLEIALTRVITIGLLCQSQPYPYHMWLYQQKIWRLLTKDALKIKANLAKIEHCLGLLQTAAIRLFIITSLYNEKSPAYLVFSEEKFFYINWQKEIQYRLPKFTNLTINNLLFADHTEQLINLFIHLVKKRYRLVDQQINNLLQSQPFYTENNKQSSSLNRTLRNNFTNLATRKEPLLGKYQRGKYKKNDIKTIIEYFTDSESPDPTAEVSEYLNTSLIRLMSEEFSTIVELFLEQIQGKQRLFIYHEYVVPEHLQESSANIASRLQLIWNEPIIPPIKISYYSSSLDYESDYIVYPVCIYYYRRAYYLCAYGQTPYSQDKLKNQWYNYRLEKITHLEKLSWSTPNLPLVKSEILEQEDKYSPEYIAQEFKDAYGFDFYQNSELMLLKFNPDFSRRYIETSFRHESFEKVNDVEEIIGLIKYAKIPEEEKLINHIKSHANFGYYTLNYRRGDNNVIMRLRAWMPNVEVLLPWQLRQSIVNDLRQSFHLYHQ